MKQLTKIKWQIMAFVLILVPAFLTAQVQRDKDIALVLSGGGGRGAYEIGAWKALTDLGFRIGGVYGASVGSINATGIIMNDYKKVRDLWFKISYLSVMNISPKAVTLFRGDYNKLSFGDYIDIMREFRSSRGIDITPLKGLLEGIISEKKIRASSIDYGLAAFSVTKLEPKMLYIDQIPEGELLNYVLASANFPLFKRQEIKGELFIDGGIYSNVPVEMAVNRGFKNIIVVDIAFQTPIDLVNLVKNDFDESINISLIRPSRHFGSFLTFEKSVSEKYLKEGFLDTMKVFGYLRGEKYYIYGEEDIIREMFDNLPKEKKKTALSLLKAGDIENIKEEKLFEKEVLPVLRLAVLGSLGRSAEKVDLQILEKLAEEMHLEILSVYTQKEIIDKLVDNMVSKKPNLTVPSFFAEIRFGKIIDFIKYLGENSYPELPPPEGYTPFRHRYNELLN